MSLMKGKDGAVSFILVSPLIVIMKDQVEQLNKIRVAAMAIGIDKDIGGEVSADNRRPQADGYFRCSFRCSISKQKDLLLSLAMGIFFHFLFLGFSPIFLLVIFLTVPQLTDTWKRLTYFGLFSGDI